MIVYFKGISE